MTSTKALSNTSDVLNTIIKDAASTLQSRNATLDWHWLNVRNIIVDLVTHTIALGLFTSIAIGLLYIVTSRKWRDGMTAIILLCVLPDCLTQLMVWVATLSQLAQTYSLMHASILDSGALAERISTCFNNPGCDKTLAYALWNNKPDYTAYGCVGTAMIAANWILHAAAICGATVVFLFGAKRFGVATASLLFVPLLAACVSAAMHVKRECFPEPIVVGRLKLLIGWEVSGPRGIDPTTERLMHFTTAMPVLLIVHHFWVNREAFKLFLKDGPQRGRYAYWMAVTVVLPVCVKGGWFWLKDTYHHGPYAPVLEYAFFSAGDALLVPLMVIYPGLAQLVQKIWKERNPESDSIIPAPEKSDAPAPVGDTEKNETAL